MKKKNLALFLALTMVAASFEECNTVLPAVSCQ